MMKLDEALFDDKVITAPEPELNIPRYEEIDVISEADAGTSNILTDLITGAYGMIDKYNSAIVSLQKFGDEELLNELNELSTLEMTTISRLQNMLEIVNPAAEKANTDIADVASDMYEVTLYDENPIIYTESYPKKSYKFNSRYRATKFAEQLSTDKKKVHLGNGIYGFTKKRGFTENYILVSKKK